MKITTIEYRRLVTFGHYENQAVGAIGTVEEGDTPEAALDRLKEFVADQLAKIMVMNQLQRDAESERYHFENQKREHERELAQLKDRWERAKAFLEKFGVPTGPHDDIPF